MTNGICPNCKSKNIYKSQNTSWSNDGITIQVLGDKITEAFATEAYVCLDCRHFQMHVAEYSAAIFGKGKPFKESIEASSNWKRSN